jgi:hypothetical protein
MHRSWYLGACLLFLAGCQSPAERLPINRLPDDAPPMPFAELLTRARMQASAANEAFYVNRWSDLEDAAQGLEQTARFLPKATEVPAGHKEKLPDQATTLGKEAVKLRQAAIAQDVTKVNESLQRVNLKVRELRLD